MSEFTKDLLYLTNGENTALVAYDHLISFMAKAGMCKTELLIAKLEQAVAMHGERHYPSEHVFLKAALAYVKADEDDKR